MWITSPALAQTVLFHDGFNIDGPNIDRTKWTGPATAYFLGRTQLRLASAPVAVVGGAAVLTFDTFNSATPGTFRGVEIETNQYFPVSTGLAFEARVKPAANLPRGLVTSLFSYVFRDLGGGVRQQDEIDWEFLTNQLVGRTQPVVSTNVYVDEFLGAGSPVLVGLPDTVVLGEWNTLRVEWYPNRVHWLVNGQLVFERTDRVPNDAMSVRLNFWAPDSNWTAAYSSALTPAATAAQNQTFQYLVDYVTVYRLPGLATADLDSDGRFSIDDLYRISRTNQDVNATGTIDTDDQQAVAFPLRAREVELMAGRSPRTIVVNPGFDAAAPNGPITRWTMYGNTIGNVSRSSEAPRNDGSALKIFGQFTGGTNESGAYQDFDIRAGRTITARVWARQRCADRFTGANTATLNLRFLNAAGAIISTSTVLAGNASTPCDQYALVTLTATAPPGTVTTRLLLRVNQPASAGGAVHFDDVELSVQ
jgi:beta-glucanase (GH16 family)